MSTPQAVYAFRTVFINRKKRSEVIDSYTLKQAIAVGLSWSVGGNFKVYDMNGNLIDVYENAKPLRV